MTLSFIGIIPARYGSTRFPGKPLAMLGDKTVIQRVWEQVSLVLDRVVVATDDSRILDAVEAFGGQAVMTSTSHRSGTDRCHEAFATLGNPADVVVNIQGDEPFIHPRQLQSLMACFDNQATDIATLVRPFEPTRPYAELENPNTPKVVLDAHMRARYFSHSVIPYVRGCQREQWPTLTQYYTHIGLYAYRASVLAAITRLPQSPLELAESLEQLRWLENGYTIQAATSTEQTIGIDTPTDLQRAEQFLIHNANA
ncbi:MAG: 3-deoxy-manno-octulosonate cytidylyltransferase [Muribaculaceae bacterium]|nr:3-deoxy-manno-octulosonate cytidylyltransferase [Muribaculaceae bacterium]